MTLLPTKKCPCCKVSKTLDEYSIVDGNTGKTRTYCKACTVDKTREWQLKNRDKVLEAKKRSNLKKLYGISYEQYKKLLKDQKYSCAICERHESEFKRRLAVDHNHVTGEIRGLLCNYCNHRLIGRHRDGNKLRQMADYVDSGTGWFVPKKKRPIKRKPK